MNKHKANEVSVLYVEDEAAAREEIQQLLDRRMKEVLVATNGREGLELFKEKRPDLVITDIRMPVMNGLEMAKAIKAIAPDAQIIVTSAFSDTPYLLTAIETGIDAYVMKPVEAEKLFTAIRKCVEIIESRMAARNHLAEQQKTLDDLQAALTKVKQLSGFLPICASCKKIRDDQGYWQQIEAYIQANSEAVFSHGICPDCVKKLYPEHFEQLYGDKS